MLKHINLQLFAETDPTGNKDGAADGGAGAAGAAAGNAGAGAAGKASDEKGNTGDEKKFTQADVDSLIDKRFAREKAAWEKQLAEEKKKATMTETEKLATEKAETEKRASDAISKANQRLIRAEVMVQASTLGIVDPEAAFLLMDKADVAVDENTDKITGVKEALDALVKSKPYLIKAEGGQPGRAGDDQSNPKGGGRGVNMNDLIRRAANRVI